MISSDPHYEENHCIHHTEAVFRAAHIAEPSYNVSLLLPKGKTFNSYS